MAFSFEQGGLQPVDVFSSKDSRELARISGELS